MADHEPIVELDEEYSEPGASPPPWSQVRDVIATAEMFWLSTVRRDGRPHVTPLPAVWRDGALHICTGEREQKAVNLAREPRCILATGANEFRAGLDVVVEGEAVRVTEDARLQERAALWKSKLDWDFVVADGGFREPGFEHGPASVYAVAPAKVLAFGKSPYTQTRYRSPT